MTLGRSELNHINMSAHVPNCAPLSLGEDRQDMRLATQCSTVPRVSAPILPTHDFLQSGSLRMNHSDTKHQRRHDDQLANEPCFRSPWKKWCDLCIRLRDNINTVSEAQCGTSAQVYVGKTWLNIEPVLDGHVLPETVGGVYSATEQDSLVGGGAKVICLGVVHMEEGVQVKVQVEVGREKVGVGETHGESQNEEATKNKRSTAHHGLHGDGMTHACRHLSQCSVMCIE